MATLVSKWGNSIGVRIPVDLADELGLKPGSQVRLTRSGRGLKIVPVIAEPPAEYSLDKLLSGITDENTHGETETGVMLGAEQLD